MTIRAFLFCVTKISWCGICDVGISGQCFIYDMIKKISLYLLKYLGIVKYKTYIC